MYTSILHMHLSQDLHEQIVEEQAAAVDWKARCGYAMADLKAIDPQGWESWYDENVKDGGWKSITEQVSARVEVLLKTRKHLFAIGKHSAGRTEIVSP